jgi:single-strand DNA-binding protein
VNVVTMIGNLATDVDLREVGEGKKVATFLLAVDRRSRDGGADFFRVSVWERQAELCAEYLAKGRRIGVEGRLRSDSWQDGDGKRRTSVEIVAQHVEFLARPAAEGDVPFEPATVAS